MRTLFEILRHEIDGQNILVTILKNGEEKDMKVNKSRFEEFLERSGRLEIPMQFHNDEEGEESCELAFSAMTYPEYYEHGDVKLDLYDYILTKDGEKIFNDALSSLQSACNDYQN